jgi:hypothetical protein
LQQLGARLREIPPDAVEWTETVSDPQGVTRTVKRPGAAREQLAAEAVNAAYQVSRRWNSYPGNDAELMMAVVADVYDAAGDAELAAEARDTLNEWGADTKALLVREKESAERRFL